MTRKFRDAPILQNRFDRIRIDHGQRLVELIKEVPQPYIIVRVSDPSTELDDQIWSIVKLRGFIQFSVIQTDLLKEMESNEEDIDATLPQVMHQSNGQDPEELFKEEVSTAMNNGGRVTIMYGGEQ